MGLFSKDNNLKVGDSVLYKGASIKLEYSDGTTRSIIGPALYNLASAPKGAHVVKLWTNGELIHASQTNFKNPTTEWEQFRQDWADTDLDQKIGMFFAALVCIVAAMAIVGVVIWGVIELVKWSFGG